LKYGSWIPGLAGALGDDAGTNDLPANPGVAATVFHDEAIFLRGSLRRRTSQFENLEVDT
jgi:hypothetical protein